MASWAGPIVEGVSAIWSGKAQARAMTHAANVSAQSAREAARLRAESEQTQLQYLKGESRLSREADEVARRASFGQWDVGEQNVHNTLRDTLLNKAADERARSLTAVDLANVAARNARSQFNVERGDQNLLLTRRDARMRGLGGAIGTPPRAPLVFGQIDPLVHVKTFDPGAPQVTARVTTPYVPGVTSEDVVDHPRNIGGVLSRRNV